MSNDFCRVLQLSDSRRVVVHYHYEEYSGGGLLPVIDGVLDEDMEEDIKIDGNEDLRLCDMIVATFRDRDLHP